MSLVDAAGAIKFAAISESTAATNEIVAAVTSRKIRILGLFLMAADTNTLTIEDEDGNDLIGPVTVDPNGGFVLPPNGLGWQETPLTKALHLLQSAANQVGGSITYQEIQ